MKAEKRIDPNDHFPTSKKRPSHASQERERDTNLGSRPEGKKGARREKKNTPKAQQRDEEKDIDSSPMGLNQNPAQGQKGWGLVRTEPTCKNTGEQSCQNKRELHRGL